MNSSLLNLLNLLKNINISNILNNTSKTLNVVKKSIPVYKEIRPYINHEKSIFKNNSNIKESNLESTNKTYNDSLTFFQ